MVAWMYWTLPTMITICIFFIFLLIIAVLDLKKRSTPRKGFLPFPTTRGDRIFISVIIWIAVSLIWLAILGDAYITALPLILVVIMIIVMKYF